MPEQSYQELYGVALTWTAANPSAPTKDERRQAQAMAEAAMRGRLDRERIDRGLRALQAITDEQTAEDALNGQA